MYINELSLDNNIEDKYSIKEAMNDFLELYKTLVLEYQMNNFYLHKKQKFYIQSAVYPIEKWLNDTSVDKDKKRLFLIMNEKIIHYNHERDCEVWINEAVSYGATEAILNDSFMVSFNTNKRWKNTEVSGELYTLFEDGTEQKTEIVVQNISSAIQLDDFKIRKKIDKQKEYKIYNYSELWYKKQELFTHLVFCSSVKEDLQKLENYYINQIVRKLTELNDYVKKYGKEGFNHKLLLNATPESESTLKKYKKIHTFYDLDGVEYIASWHIRFTGIPGRIFFIPNYRKELMLICYIGKKLANSNYPTM